MSAALDAWLKTQPGIWRGDERHSDARSIATGFARLDDALPARGWSIGTVTELLIAREGIGEFSLALPAIREVTASGQWIALIGAPHVPYAPALVNAGIDLAQLLVVNTSKDNDTLWAAEQVLRAGTFTGVILWVNRSSARMQRRLQLAAENGDTWAIVYRPVAARHEHSPVALRMVVDVEEEHVLLDIVKARGGQTRNVKLDTSDFDQPQGVDWPLGVLARNMVSLRSVCR